MRSSGNTTETVLSGNTPSPVSKIRKILEQHVPRERVDLAFEGKPATQIEKALAEANAEARAPKASKVSRQIAYGAKANDRRQHYLLGEDFE